MDARNFTMIIGLTAVMAAVPSAHAITGCSNSWLNGNFGMQFSGTAAPAVAPGVGGIPVPPRMAASAQAAQAAGGSGNAPTAGIARLYLDGAGNISGYSSINLQGVWLQSNVSGTYAVNADCSASLSITDSNGNTENFSGTLVGQGDSAMVLQTDPGTGVAGVLKRVRGSCQTSDLFGTFGLQYSGSVVASSSPYSSVGIISLDGQGNATTNESRFSSGTYASASATGTIAINPDCTAALTLSTDTASANFWGIVSFDQKQVLLVQSDAGTTATATLLIQ